MWDLPGPELEPMSPALAGGLLTTAPPGKSPELVLKRALPVKFPILGNDSHYSHLNCQVRNLQVILCHFFPSPQMLYLTGPWCSYSTIVTCIHTLFLSPLLLREFTCSSSSRKTMSLVSLVLLPPSLPLYSRPLYCSIHSRSKSDPFCIASYA